MVSTKAASDNAVFGREELASDCDSEIRFVTKNSPLSRIFHGLQNISRNGFEFSIRNVYGTAQGRVS